MTPKHILAFAALMLVVFLGVIGIVDATEPGVTLDEPTAAAVALALAGLAGAAVGLSLMGVKWRKAKKPTEDE